MAKIPGELHSEQYVTGEKGDDRVCLSWGNECRSP